MDKSDAKDKDKTEKKGGKEKTSSKDGGATTLIEIGPRMVCVCVCLCECGGGIRCDLKSLNKIFCTS